MRSPIEQMVDAACGITDADRRAWAAEEAAIKGRDADDEWLILHCPQCGRFVGVERQPEIDPPAATLLELLCDACWEEGAESFYYDVTGRELGPNDWPTARGEKGKGNTARAPVEHTGKE